MKKVISVRSPKWANYKKTAITVEAIFEGAGDQPLPFTATPNDPEDYGRFIYEQAIAGEYGDIAEWEAPENVVGDAAISELRIKRNALLSETDYIEMPTKWATLSEEQQTAWAEYRNALRDLPAQYPNVELRWNDEYSRKEWANVFWPAKPE